MGENHFEFCWTYIQIYFVLSPFAGMACNRRILWEHTKGRYTCVQCGFMGSSRKEMTQHINNQHTSNRAAEDTGSGASNT